MTARANHLRELSLALALSSVAGCAAPRPSGEPLGWGPIAQGMRADRPAPKPRSDRPKKTPAESGRVASTPHADGDAGARAMGPPATTPDPSRKDHEQKPSDPAAAKLRGADFVGDFTGEDVATYRVDGLPDRVERDPKARLTVRSPSEHDVELVLVDSSNGTDICTLKGTTTDTGVTVAPGQKCFEQNGGETTSAATIARGTATIEKSRLVLELELDFQMELAERSVSGKLEYRFDGTRR
jgi:hypothetical protein